MILIDTGPIVAAATKHDQHHAVCLAALSALREPPLITPLALMEGYFLSTRAQRLRKRRSGSGWRLSREMGRRTAPASKDLGCQGLPIGDTVGYVRVPA